MHGDQQLALVLIVAALLVVLSGKVRWRRRRKPNGTPVLDVDGDYLTLEDCGRSVLAFGAIGSGKTSGLANLILAIAKQHQVRMVFCCVKPTDCEHYLKICHLAGRNPLVFSFDS